MKKIAFWLLIIPALYYVNPALRFNIVEAAETAPGQAQTQVLDAHQ